jgi:hypothetical protein
MLCTLICEFHTPGKRVISKADVSKRCVHIIVDTTHRQKNLHAITPQPLPSRVLSRVDTPIQIDITDSKRPIHETYIHCS